MTADDRPVLSVIVVSYNTLALTIECLRSLLAETSVAYEVLVVDNASADLSAATIRAQFPGVRLFEEPINHGFATANNIAAEAASGEYLLLLNPDTVVLAHAVDRLLEFARRTPSARIWGGRTIFPDGNLNRSNCWRQMGVWTNVCRVVGLDTSLPGSRVFNREAYGGWNRDTERQVDIVSGCFFLIETALWRDLGGFDEHFVMYGEEADLCLRARKFGARPRVTPSATIVHYGGASERVLSQKHVKLLQAKISLARRHVGRPRRWLVIGLLRLWPTSRWLAAELLARVRPVEARRLPRAAWADVWADRRTWWSGYPQEHR
jgi:GT2 family glycosyltransferase